MSGKAPTNLSTTVTSELCAAPNGSKRIPVRLRRRLVRATARNVEFFGVPVEPVWAKVVSVYDGDSFHAIFSLAGQLSKWRIRVFGIDTPEVRVSKTVPEPERTQRKARAIEVRDYVRSLTLGRIARITPAGFGKYGRLLAHVSVDLLGGDADSPDAECVNLSDHLIEKGMACAYFGGTKKMGAELAAATTATIAPTTTRKRSRFIRFVPTVVSVVSAPPRKRRRRRLLSPPSFPPVQLLDSSMDGGEAIDVPGGDGGGALSSCAIQ